MLKRRILLLACGLGLAAAAAQAQFRVEISGVGATQVPLAVLRFREEDKSPQPISAIVRADLERSGLFSTTDPGNVVADELSRPNYADWRAKPVDALVAGSVQRLADGRFDVRFKLWDVVKGADLTAQAFAVHKDDLRLAAHRIADEIYLKLTGEKGVFSTRISYVSKSAGLFTLWVADADGQGAQEALKGSEPIISPAWSPDGRELAYVSFEDRKAKVYVQDITSGKRRSVANFRGSNSAPAWSPDGATLAVTLSREGGSQLFMMGRGGENVRRFTSSSAIDTEAAWSADGTRLYFVSDRGGGPQIYRMPAGGGSAERVTLQGNYNISPALSPDGRYMAFVTRNGGAFKLMVMDLASGTVTALTDTSDDESPSFAPNSRLIIYASRSGGRDVLMTTTLDGKIKAKLGAPQADVREPVWGPYGR
ncbi:MAG: Tol-Pal system beta propeller repeat protein TolB [Burkholderiales bacterium]